MDRTLFIFGAGFVGQAFARLVMADGWRVGATARGSEQAEVLNQLGVAPVDAADEAALTTAIGQADAILVTAPPGPHGCPGLAAIAPALARSRSYPGWIGYLSTTGVYGDSEGRWVDEASPVNAQSLEGARRVSAERDWTRIGQGMDLPTAIFRLPGIYGPGRSAFDRLQEGTARRIAIPGHVFSRVHRDDIASGLALSLAKPRAGAVYNLVDDEPAPGEAVIEYAAKLLGIDPPQITTDIPEKSRRFYAENRRVANALAKAELGWRPAYPSYREGLTAIAKASTVATSRARS